MNATRKHSIFTNYKTMRTMKKLTFKTMMFALVMLFAASATMVFTSCGDDKDDPKDQSLIGQWEVTNFAESFPEDVEDNTAAVYDFKTDGTYSIYLKDKVDKKWYYLLTNEYVYDQINPETGKGLIKYKTWRATGEVEYWFEGKQLILKAFVIGQGDWICKLKRTSGITPEPWDK